MTSILESALRSFVLRLRSQFEQLHRFLFTTIERFVHAMEIVLRGGEGMGWSLAFRRLFELGPTSKEGVSSGGDEKSVERDYFNLRKAIIVSTLTGEF